MTDYLDYVHPDPPDASHFAAWLAQRRAEGWIVDVWSGVVASEGSRIVTRYSAIRR